MTTATRNSRARAVRIWDAIKPMPGTQPPDVSLKPYMLTRHTFARIDTSRAPAEGMAVSNPSTVPLGHRPMEQRA